jgi:hypothetical protein
MLTTRFAMIGSACNIVGGKSLKSTGAIAGKP